MNERLDVYLYKNGYFSSRSAAQDSIKEGNIKVNDKVILKSSHKISENDTLQVQEKELNFASRGGYKLYYALHSFEIHLKDKVVLDVGASTGGFSDVCLKEGASYVYALDAGKDQLVDTLKQNPKVKNMENINARYLQKEMFDKRIDFVCMDVSFISIKLIVDSLLNILESPFECVFLIKPQFEAGKEHIGKNGIVKDKKVHKRILSDYIQYFKEKKLGVLHLEKSRTIGRDGNQEYLIHISSKENQKMFDLNKIINE